MDRGLLRRVGDGSVEAPFRYEEVTEGICKRPSLVSTSHDASTKRLLDRLGLNAADVEMRVAPLRDLDRRRVRPVRFGCEAADADGGRVHLPVRLRPESVEYIGQAHSAREAVNEELMPKGERAPMVQKGNALAKKHGAWSDKIVDPVARDLVSVILEQVGYHTDRAERLRFQEKGSAWTSSTN